MTHSTDQLTAAATASLWPPVHLDEIGLRLGTADNNVEILRGIDLKLATGDFVCVLGSSGCGKTSLLRVIAGYQQPSTGTVYIAGKSHTQPNADVGVVFQRPNLLPWLTIAQNVEFGPKMRRIPPLERRQLVSRYLELVGLVEASQRLPHQLSGGMQQRAAIARTLAANPEVVLMDEPFGALDALTRQAMQTHLRGLWERTRKTIFFITHDVEEALLLATRIVVMHARPGRIVRQLNNPFVGALEQLTADELRTLPEFVRLRQELIASIHQEASSK